MLPADVPALCGPSSSDAVALCSNLLMPDNQPNLAAAGHSSRRIVEHGLPGLHRLLSDTVERVVSQLSIICSEIDDDM